MQEYSLTEPNHFKEDLELYYTLVSVLDKCSLTFDNIPIILTDDYAV